VQRTPARTAHLFDDLNGFDTAVHSHRTGAPASAAAMAWLTTLALMNCGWAPKTVRIRFMFDSCWRFMGKR